MQKAQFFVCLAVGFGSDELGGHVALIWWAGLRDMSVASTPLFAECIYSALAAATRDALDGIQCSNTLKFPFVFNQ